MGAPSTLALLLLILAQGISGLFSVDDASFDGPLAYAFDGQFIDAAIGWHGTTWGILQQLIALHLVAIARYQRRKRQPILQTTWQSQSADRVSEYPPVHMGRAVVAAVSVAACLWFAIAWAPRVRRRS